VILSIDAARSEHGENLYNLIDSQCMDPRAMLMLKEEVLL